MSRLYLPVSAQARGHWLHLGLILLSLAGAESLGASNLLLDDSLPLRMPMAGDHQLRLISSNLLEVLLITAKEPAPAPLTQWNFVDTNGNLTLPAPSEFAVTADGQPVAVQTVGYKCCPLYARYGVYDLRLANCLYLQLASAIAPGTFLQVQNPSTALWATNVLFTLTVEPLRYSPAVHVNQVGYVPGWPKKAMVGYYLGTCGELNVPTSQGFHLISTATSNTVFSGTLVARPDAGFTYSPTPYQQVFEADFSPFQTPGQYKLVVPGLGTSLPFLIDEGVAGTAARAYELGIYHQRCGTNNTLPYTRFVHGSCHTNLAQVPTLALPEFDFANSIVNELSASTAHDPLETAPRMTNVAASLYPFVNQGYVDVSGGHHDAGDYSKYTLNVAAFIHYLMFAVDAFPGAGNLDNLGIPESGDGIGDLVQEAKWEADFLARMQDADGGFYFNVYPKNRQYEYDVLPDRGDPQIVLPKNTAATAAAVAALAEIASSPAFKAAYPAAASSYLSQALAGWNFLTDAFARFGRNGSYQAISYLGNEFMHNDELAWAAAALFAATGDRAFDSDLRTYTPNPNDPNLRLWKWWSMWGPYGCAFRDYAFAARTGRLKSHRLNGTYLAQCQAEIQFAASNALAWSVNTAYGTSFPEPSKATLLTGWYFSGDKAFDPAVAYLLDPEPALLDVVLKNFNYELGCNPINITFLTGLGSKRQRDIVHQYAENDDRVLPPSGIPIGNIQVGFDWTALYGDELNTLCVPLDTAPTDPYPMYDRWGDTWNGPTEFVVSQQSARSVATAAWLMAITQLKTQAWNSASASIAGLPLQVVQNESVSANLAAPGVDLSRASIVWEALDQEPFLGSAFAFIPSHFGTNWVEVEAQLPDGRRVFAATNFFALPTAPLPSLETNADMVALYPLGTNFADATGRQPDLTPSYAAPDGIGLRVFGLGEYVSVNLPNAAVYDPGRTLAISVEASLYINHFNAFGAGRAYLLALSKEPNTQLALYQDTYSSQPDVYGNYQIIVNGTILTNVLTLGQWHLVDLAITRTGYMVCVDGTPIFSNTSGDLINWSGAGLVGLRAGDFDGWVRNLVVRNLPPPRLSQITKLANGDFQFFFNGSTSLSYTVQASTNLVNWTVIGSATPSAPDTFQFTDVFADSFQTRFYRVSVP